MRRRPRSALFAFAASLWAIPLTTLWIGEAYAGPPGMMPGGGPMGPGMGPGAGGPGNREKKEGPAEEAPKDKKALRAIEPVPAQPSRARRVQFFEAHGYLRLRADYFHRLDFGLVPDTQAGEDDLGNKFFQPPAQTPEPGQDGLEANQVNCVNQLDALGVSPARIVQRCRRRAGISSANMRFRFEPTLHISDSVKVHSQVDILDNVVLGSTPDSFGGDSPWAPIDLYTRSQMAPVSGINSFRDSVVVKRAWGHIKFGFGMTLQFGRMPQHWGMGILYNDGNGYDRLQRDDIIRMLDMDYGDSVDSVRLSYDLGKDPRRKHVITGSYDWAATGPTTGQLLGPTWDSGNRVGQDFSVEKYDNVHQFRASIERRDTPDMLRRKLALDLPVFNYGLATWMRFQRLDRAIGSPGLGDGLGHDAVGVTGDGIDSLGDPLGNGLTDADGETALQNYANALVLRRGVVITPDLWMRVNWRTMRVEFETAGVFGTFRHRDLGESPSSATFDLDRAVANTRTTLAQFGYALEFKYGWFQDRFHFGFDHGFASGDQSPSYRYDYMHPFTQSRGLAGSTGGNGLDGTFRFNPAYTQDLLLFRETLGTIANAAYFKPWIAFYFFQGYMSGRADIQFATAQSPTATPGNKFLYGLELDAAIRYHDVREPIFVQLQYGVLFPFGAFNRSPAAFNVRGDGDARAAQSIQAQVGIRF
jgi:hypothetical protein